MMKDAVETIFGKRVREVNADNKTLSTEDDTMVSFDQLPIASGADPRPIKAARLHLKNIFYMRTASTATIRLFPK